MQQETALLLCTSKSRGDPIFVWVGLFYGWDSDPCARDKTRFECPVAICVSCNWTQACWNRCFCITQFEKYGSSLFSCTGLHTRSLRTREIWKACYLRKNHLEFQFCVPRIMISANFHFTGILMEEYWQLLFSKSCVKQHLRIAVNIAHLLSKLDV